jgi:hypothetical protein
MGNLASRRPPAPEPWVATLVQHNGTTYKTTPFATNASVQDICAWYAEENLYRYPPRLIDADFDFYCKMKFYCHMHNAYIIPIFEIAGMIMTRESEFHEIERNPGYQIFTRAMVWSYGGDHETATVAERMRLFRADMSPDILGPWRAMVPYVPAINTKYIEACMKHVSTEHMDPYWRVPCTEQNNMGTHYIRLTNESPAVTRDFIRMLYKLGCALQLAAYPGSVKTYWSTTADFENHKDYIFKLDNTQYQQWMHRVIQTNAGIAPRIAQIQAYLDTGDDAPEEGVDTA